ncbi:MAG TPA: hypothetical protein VGD10_03165 [Allosphingosinicella sp.]|uniref:hypothetical protein n=1 Tax=Allosphingosinicella sp. TaxID=2823234 RepID=UPI002ED99F65
MPAPFVRPTRTNFLRHPGPDPGSSFTFLSLHPGRNGRGAACPASRFWIHGHYFGTRAFSYTPIFCLIPAGHAESHARPAPPIPVICDCCRARGLSGEDPFAAFGALLDFDPVPRYSKRADGWDAEVQRAYIAALSLTGNDRAACRAVGKSAYGVTQLLEHEGGEGFRAAREEALAMAADERSRRLAEGLRTVAAEQADWRPPEAPWARAATRNPSPKLAPKKKERMTYEQKEEILTTFLHRYLIKLRQERQARLEGKVIAADFYLRQICWIEAAMDLFSGSEGVGNLLLRYRHKGQHLIDIVETPYASLLNKVRRIHWAEAGEPPRPEHPPRRYLQEHGGFSTEPLEFYSSGPPEFQEEQKRAFEERHARDAEELVRWEAQALKDAEAWRKRLEEGEE